MLCVLLVMVSSTPALAANDGISTATPDGTVETTQGVVSPPPQTGACRQAKARSRPQLTPEQKAQRRAERQAQHATPGTDQRTAKAHKPRPAKLPLC
jgi:hypothetical protein